MITVTICRKSGAYSGFSVKGHAGYDDEGNDIICSAVSMLTLNTVNSIEAFTDDDFSAECGDGVVKLELTNIPSGNTVLLIDSMVLGLTQVQKDYGDAYIKFEYEEV